MRIKFLKWIQSTAVFIAVCCATTPLFAGNIENTNSPDSELRIGVPLWASGVKGTIGVLNRPAEIDESFSDILDDLNFTAALLVEGRTCRWVYHADCDYVATTANAQPKGELLSEIVSKVALEQKQILANAWIGYRIVQSDLFSLDVFGGARFNYLDGEIRFNLPATKRSYSDSKFWVDPIVGLRTEYELTQHVGLYAKGDVGGFDVASDLTWQIEGGFDFKITQHTYARLAYRFLSTDFKDGGFTYDVDLKGPQLEFGVRF